EMTSGEAASFKGSYHLEGRELTVQINAKFRKRVYEPQDWPSFREAVSAHKKISDNPVILNMLMN
ncbi:MAG: hypothetical protein JW861_12655, partial [Bacteroidales bacterium]|nr:hypothetical protein [Bacteroidales bacterium]